MQVLCRGVLDGSLTTHVAQYSYDGDGLLNRQADVLIYEARFEIVVDYELVDGSVSYRHHFVESFSPDIDVA